MIGHLLREGIGTVRAGDVFDRILKGHQHIEDFRIAAGKGRCTNQAVTQPEASKRCPHTQTRYVPRADMVERDCHRAQDLGRGPLTLCQQSRVSRCCFTFRMKTPETKG